jgi:hypothetical protein
MHVLFDTECTQDLEKREGSFEHIPNLISFQQVCSKSEEVNDFCVDCKPCGRRNNVFWAEEPIGKFIYYRR